MSRTTLEVALSTEEANQQLARALARQAELDAGVSAAQAALRAAAAARAGLLAQVASGKGTTTSDEVMQADDRVRRAQIDLEIANLTASTGQTAIDEGELAVDQAKAREISEAVEAADRAVQSEVAVYAKKLQAARDALARVIETQRGRAAAANSAAAHNAAMRRKRPNDSSVQAHALVRSYVESADLLVQAASLPYGQSRVEWDRAYLPS